MKKFQLFTVVICSFLITSCSNPGKKSISIVTENDKICGLDLLSDTNVVMEKITQWQKDNKFEITKSSNSLGQLIECRVPVSKEDYLNMRFDFIKGKLFKATVTPSFKSNDGFEYYKTEIKAFLDKRYKILFENPPLWNIGQPDFNISQNASTYALEMHIDFNSRISNNLKEIYKATAALSPKQFSLDFRDGTVTVPEGKLWILNKCRRMSINSMDSTKQWSNSVVNCGSHIEGDRTKWFDLAVNGVCRDVSGILVWSDNGSSYNTMSSNGNYNDPNTIEIIDINSDTECKLLPAGVSFAVASPPKFPYGNMDYMWIAYYEISEYDLSQVKNSKELIEFIKSLGFQTNEYYFVKFFNNKP